MAAQERDTPTRTLRARRGRRFRVQARVSVRVRVSLQEALDANSSTSTSSWTSVGTRRTRRALRVSRRAAATSAPRRVREAGRAPGTSRPFASVLRRLLGARWNLVAGASLRDTVRRTRPSRRAGFFERETFFHDSPFRFAGRSQEQNTRGAAAKKAAPKAANRRASSPGDETPREARRVVGVFACFAVSGAMHEFVLWALEGRSSRLGTSRAIGWSGSRFEGVAQAPLVSGGGVRGKDELAQTRREKTPEDARRKPPTLATVFFVRAAKTVRRFSPRSSRWRALFFPPVARNSRTRASWRTCAKRWGWGSFRRFYK